MKVCMCVCVCVSASNRPAIIGYHDDDEDENDEG